MSTELLAKIKSGGVVGAGGAGFPTHIKLAAKAKTVIVNGAECEPLLKVDQQLMAEQPKKLLGGLELAMEIVGASQGIIALKGKYKSAIAALEAHLTSEAIKIHILDDFYPAGDEQVTVYETTGRLVPQGKIPLEVDCIVTNVETLLNLVDAVAGKPVVDTYITITGAISEPVTLKLPIGTAVATALEFAGATELNGMKVIEGGPMMGKVVEDLSQPITKTTKGLIVLPEDHPIIRKKTLSLGKIIKQAKAACIQCRFCTDLCPRYLLGHKIEPHKIMRALRHIQDQEDTVKMALTCTECGACEQYACIMGISPRIVNATIKQELMNNGIKAGLQVENQTVHTMQEHRKIPVKRLIGRLGLSKYDSDAPLSKEEFCVKEVKINLRQHIGAPSTPKVKVGQQVARGTIIAAIPDKSLGANIHASISGVVTEITDSIVIRAVEGSE